MNELKFNSQICTNEIQSQRLLELGLKPETADMHYMAKTHWGDNWFISKNERYYSLGFGYHDELRHRYNGAVEVIPAWSLHRLIEMCGIDRMPISFHKKGKIRIRVNHIHPTHEGRSGYNHYNSLIDCIEWLISENYFNKEYLKQ